MIIKRKMFATSIENLRDLKGMSDEEVLRKKERGLSPAAVAGAGLAAGVGVSKGMKYVGKNAEALTEKILRNTTPSAEKLAKSKGARLALLKTQEAAGKAGAGIVGKLQGVSRKNRRLAGAAAAVATVAALRRSKNDKRYNETLGYMKENAAHRDRRNWDREMGEVRRFRLEQD